MNVMTARGGGKVDRRHRVERKWIERHARPWCCLAATSALTVLVGPCLPAHAQDVAITSDTGAVNLDTATGSTARVFPGVTVSGGTFSSGMSATTAPWTLTNDGKVTGSNGLSFKKGGGLDNSAGATVEGDNSGAVFGTSGGSAYVTVNNHGTINGKSVEGVTLLGGGIVTNFEGATISATSSGNALSLSSGTERTVVNSGKIINYGTAGNSTGVLIQGGAGSITNNATGEIKGGYNGIYASGSAPLTLINAGTIQSTRGPAVEMGGGGTVTNSGTIQSAATGILFSNTGSITNRGTIGSTGAGLAIQFNGSLAHSLTLDTGSVLNGNVRGGTGVDDLVLTGSGTESIAKFLNFEKLTMQGSDWDLTSAGTFSASSAITAGTLRVNGTLTSPAVTIGSAGKLGGTGTIVGAVTNYGTIGAGNGSGSIGTLSVNGALAFAPGSVLQVDANPAGQADLVAVTGTAAINGGTVQVLAATGTYSLSTAYTIVSTTTGRTGAFSGVTSNFAFLAPTLTYDANNVYLTLNRNNIDLDAIGGTPNQRATGAGVQALDGGNPVFDAVLMLDVAGARRAFDQLSGEIHASVPGLLLDDSRFVREAALDRVRQAFTDKSGVWGHAYGAYGENPSDGNAADFNARSGGFFVGADTAIDDTWRFGALAGHGRSTFDAEARASSGSADSFHLAAYGGGQWNDFSLRGGAAYAWQTIEAGRSVTFPGFSDRLSARYDGHVGQIFGEAGYALHMAGATVEPTASLAYVDAGTNAFSETGGAAALSSDGTDIDTTFSTLGIRATAPLALGGLAAKVSGFVGWRHAFGDTVPTIDVAFAGHNPFTIAGTPIARDVAVIDLGLDIQTSTAARLAFSYSGQFGDGAASQAFKTGLHVSF
jgi:outer membrane autotransporter protein